MSILLIIFHLFHFASANNNKPYEGYEEIVEKLSSYRTQRLTNKLSTSMPRERFHIALGLSNTNTKVNDYGLGTVVHNGFAVGVALPLIEKQLFVELNGKFYKSVDDGIFNSSLQQFDARINHKEPLDFAILNLGAGLSSRFLTVSSFNTETNYRIPSLMLSSGLERRVTSRISLAGELGYHRSFKDNANGKNTFELGFRFNYHL